MPSYASRHLALPRVEQHRGGDAQAEGDGVAAQVRLPHLEQRGRGRDRGSNVQVTSNLTAAGLGRLALVDDEEAVVDDLLHLGEVLLEALLVLVHELDLAAQREDVDGLLDLLTWSGLVLGSGQSQG